MKKLLPLLMFLTFSGFRPVAVTTQSAKGINENFNSLASEIERRSLNQGGIVHQNLKISSSAHVTGDVVVDGTIKTVEITVSTITATVGAVITVGCPTGFTKVTAQSRFFGCVQTAEEGSGTWIVASDDCFDTYGGRLPTKSDQYIAFSNYALTDENDEYEWLANPSGAGGDNYFLGGLTNDYSTSWASHGDSNVYRCWIPVYSLIIN